jgi:hypothetical protein
MYNGESRYNQGRGQYRQGRKMASPIVRTSRVDWTPVFITIVLLGLIVFVGYNFLSVIGGI